MRCDYHTHPQLCPNPAEFVTIYGCLNQHINEKPLCEYHYRIWRDGFEIGIGCRTCGNLLDSYRTTLAELVNPWLLTHNKTLRKEAAKYDNGTDPATLWHKSS